MKRLVCLLAFVALAPLHAVMLGSAIKLTPVTGWHQEEARPAGEEEPPYPTLKFVPKDGRNAAIILTLLPNDAPGFTVTNHASLERFNLISARPYIANPEDAPAPNVVDLSNGIAVSRTNEDPALIGKPVPPNEYRIATTVSVLLGGKYLIHCTIFYDEKDSADLREALEILRSAVVRAGPAGVPSNSI